MEPTDSPLQRDVWVRDPAQTTKPAYVDIKGSDEEFSLVDRGAKWEMFLMGNDDVFRRVLWACNLHLEKACVSTCPTLQKVVADPINTQQPTPPDISNMQNVVYEKLDTAEVVKTADLLDSLPKGNLRKAIRAYSEKVVSPYPRIVFQGLFEAAEIATCKKLEGPDLDREIAGMVGMNGMDAIVEGFRCKNNRLKHPDTRPTDKDPETQDILNTIVKFRPKVTKLLLKRLNPP